VQLLKGGFSPAPGLRVPPPTYPDTANIGSRQGDNTGRFIFILGPVPTHITLRALDEDGALLAEQVNDLDWTKDDRENVRVTGHPGRCTTRSNAEGVDTVGTFSSAL
jgi:hypothetical protein